MKKGLALLLAFVFIFEMLPLTVMAEGIAGLKSTESNEIRGTGSYTVTFITDHTTQKTIIAGNSLIENDFPTVPVQEGKVFVGWHDGNDLITIPYTPTADITLTATYEDETGEYWTVQF